MLLTCILDRIIDRISIKAFEDAHFVLRLVRCNFEFEQSFYIVMQASTTL